MLERGELSLVTANAELADRLMATARQHLASVREYSPCPRRPLVACVMGATMLRLAPFLAPRHVAEGSKRALTSAPGRIRTRDPLLRRQLLCPAELRALGDYCAWRISRLGHVRVAVCCSSDHADSQSLRTRRRP